MDYQHPHPAIRRGQLSLNRHHVDTRTNAVQPAKGWNQGESRIKSLTKANANLSRTTLPSFWYVPDRSTLESLANNVVPYA
jgi:hypothetical protein